MFVDGGDESVRGREELKDDGRVGRPNRIWEVMAREKGNECVKS